MFVNFLIFLFFDFVPAVLIYATFAGIAIKVYKQRKLIKKINNLVPGHDLIIEKNKKNKNK